MRNIALILSCWVMILPAMAQKNVERHMNFADKESLILKIQIADSITIHTWNKNEIFSKASVNINDNKDNEAYLILIDETGNSIKLNAAFKEDYFKDNQNCNTRSMITWELYVPENTALEIETINGNITIDGKTSEIDARTISGFIDLQFSPDRKADLKLKTITGTFYSDLDLTPKSKNNSFPLVITQQINSGGIPVNLETISGNIYCRKSN